MPCIVPCVLVEIKYISVLVTFTAAKHSLWYRKGQTHCDLLVLSLWAWSKKSLSQNSSTVSRAKDKNKPSF